MKRRKRHAVLENLTVENYAAEGKSIARVEGKVIFIEGAVPGDVVDVQLAKDKKDWAEGRAVRFSKLSTNRVEAFCKHFGVCGGCQWQMLPYALQLHYKQQQVSDVLSRIAKVPLPAINPILGCAEQTRYRNKMEYTFSNKRFLTTSELQDKEISSYSDVAGFHPKGFFDKVIDIDVCHLQEPPTNDIRKFVAAFGRKNNLPFYDIREHRGLLRTMQVRTTTTGQLMVNLVFGYNDKAIIRELLSELLKEFPQITTLLYTINNKKNDSLYDLEPSVFTGPGYIIEKLENFSFKISPKSFFQTNTRQAEVLYKVTREFAELTGSEVVYDLYCGTGSIGIFCSQQAARIIGVETVAEAVADARENAELNGLAHAQFFTGDVVDVCNDTFFGDHGSPDVVIIDPPRAGLHEKLVNKLLEIRSPLMVYVSCNPATQARDIQLLGAQYEVTRIQPVDMFPHTLHIENVVQLKLKK